MTDDHHCVLTKYTSSVHDHKKDIHCPLQSQLKFKIQIQDMLGVDEKSIAEHYSDQELVSDSSSDSSSSDEVPSELTSGT